MRNRDRHGRWACWIAIAAAGSSVLALSGVTLTAHAGSDPSGPGRDTGNGGPHDRGDVCISVERPSGCEL
jgi:hypothetical protein